jgi:hypothetical protein
MGDETPTDDRLDRCEKSLGTSPPKRVRGVKDASMHRIRIFSIALIRIGKILCIRFGRQSPSDGGCPL